MGITFAKSIGLTEGILLPTEAVDSNRLRTYKQQLIITNCTDRHFMFPNKRLQLLMIIALVHTAMVIASRMGHSADLDLDNTRRRLCRLLPKCSV